MNAGLKGYCPEMGEKRPETQMEARLGHYGNHYYVDSKIKLKGRGVVFLETYTAAVLVPGSRKIGWHHYKVTIRAFEKITAEHAVACEFLLS